jgi:hypothetical protein
MPEDPVRAVLAFLLEVSTLRNMELGLSGEGLTASGAR